VTKEIQITTSIRVGNGAFVDTPSPKQFTVDQAAIGRGGKTQTIGTAEEVVDFGDIATNGFMSLTNLDPTHYVLWGPESAGAMVVFGKLKPGESCGPVRVAPTVVMRAKADTAPVKLDVTIYED
jgi:hypothetical protein